MGSKPSVMDHRNKLSSWASRGVNEATVGDCKQAFTNYENQIASAFSEFKANITLYDSAFFGEQSGALKVYVDGVMDKAAALLAQLNQLAPQLDEAMEAYKNQDSAMASGLQS